MRKTPLTRTMTRIYTPLHGSQQCCSLQIARVSCLSMKEFVSAQSASVRILLGARADHDASIQTLLRSASTGWVIVQL